MKLADRMNHLGTESAFEVLARANALAAQGKSIINLGIGQPDFSTPENVVEAGRQALADGHHGYTPANGIPALREAVAADVHKRYGEEIDPDNVVCVPGGKVTMAFAMLMFGEAGAEIMSPDPGFPIYESMIRFSGATPVPIRLYEESGFSFSADEVLAGITERTRLIILNSPANPTGGVVPKTEIDKLVAGLVHHPHVAVMSDEIYSRMTYDNLKHVTLLSYPEIRDRLIILDGWSKTYAMTGWRLGWGLWPAPLAEMATRLAINTHSCVNAATQYAGIEALTGPQDAVEVMVRAFDERRLIILEALNSIPGFKCVRPLGAFYAFPNITGAGRTAKEMQDGLLNEIGVAAIAGTSFGTMGEGYLRFSYANSIENIQEAMHRIRDWLS
ncbi:MAG: pyridoxal phosphate-dependent aminotransferase [Minwuiales bacterium]|nr:pyridoxal phosphate-dependent aminotransferase [Minwuiales bacterium]